MEIYIIRLWANEIFGGAVKSRTQSKLKQTITYKNGSQFMTCFEIEYGSY